MSARRAPRAAVRAGLLPLFVVGVCLVSAASPAAAPDETLAAVLVHGNHTTPDAEILRIAGIRIGQPFTAATASEVAARLRASGRFRAVDVRIRYRSIEDPSAILLVIVVEEREGVTIANPEPGPWTRFKAGTMWLPILRFDDGYGFTYGARFAFPNVAGAHTRLAVPLSWGAERRASASLERTFEGGPLSRIVGTAGIVQRDSPAYHVDDRRTGGSIRAERAFTSSLSAGVEGGGEHVTFGDVGEGVKRLRTDVTLDTRQDAVFPRRALFASAMIERAWYGSGSVPAATRAELDARGYIPMPARFVLAVRGLHESASTPLPPFEQPMLGGAASLRGFHVGFRVGDQLSAASAELRYPLSSPVSVGSAGLAVFFDSGTVYAAHTSLSDTRWDRAVGAGFFAGAAVFTFRIDVAHGLGGGTRAHVMFGARLF